MATNTQDQLFRGLHGNPAAINKLADDYEKVASHLKRSQTRLDSAADELQAMKGKSFDSLQAHVGRLLVQYKNVAAHFTKAATELRAYAKQLQLAQTAAAEAHTRYLTAVSTLPDTFTGSTTAVPTQLLHPATYPDTAVDVTGWPPTALGVAGALNAARAEWHQAKNQKDRAADAAHDGIDASALLQALGDPKVIAGAEGVVKHLTGSHVAVAAASVGLAQVISAHKPKPGSKAAKKANARADYRSARDAITKKYADRKAELNGKLAAAKASGDTKEAGRVEKRLDLVKDREKYEQHLAQEHRDDRIERIDGKFDPKEERQEARHDAQEAKHLANEQYGLDKADAQARLESAAKSGDAGAVQRAQEHLQLVSDRHDFQTQAADLHLKSALAHIELHQHPGAHPAEAAHQLLKFDKQIADANFHERQELSNRNFAINDADLQARLHDATASGDTDLAQKLQEHRQELATAHEEQLRTLAQNHAERIDTLRHNFDTAHPHEASAHDAVGHEVVHGTAHAVAHLVKQPQAGFIEKAFLEPVRGVAGGIEAGAIDVPSETGAGSGKMGS